RGLTRTFEHDGTSATPWETFTQRLAARLHTLEHLIVYECSSNSRHFQVNVRSMFLGVLKVTR
ncbi:hypothetical protein JTL42_34695, partial [Pseudomonas aeruginosa]|nr:hypothetical protein [Pseudomonas aeruginosa]